MAQHRSMRLGGGAPNEWHSALRLNMLKRGFLMTEKPSHIGHFFYFTVLALDSCYVSGVCMNVLFCSAISMYQAVFLIICQPSVDIIICCNIIPFDSIDVKRTVTEIICVVTNQGDQQNKKELNRTEDSSID